VLTSRKKAIQSVKAAAVQLLDQMVYGTNIIPFLEIKTATQKTTMSAGTTFKNLIGGR
jgi:hypothetical protein